MSYLPPMFGEAGPLTCTRVGCNADATHHIIWTAELENGLVCGEHLAEARERWCWYAIHPYEPVCSCDGSLYIEAENRCESPKAGGRVLIASLTEAPGSPEGTTP